MAHQFALIVWRIEQLRDLGVGQLLSSRHSCLLDHECGRPSDPGQGVEQRAAFDAEGATDRSLRSAAVQRRAHGAELLGIVRRRAPAAASVRRRKPGLHPLLSPLPATRQTADVAQLSVLLGKLPGPLQLCPLICQIRAFRSFWPCHCNKVARGSDTR